MKTSDEILRDLRKTHYRLESAQARLLAVAVAAEPAWLWIRHLEDEGDHTHAGLEEDLGALKAALAAVEDLL